MKANRILTPGASTWGFLITCCLIGSLTWALGAAMLCLVCYEAPSDPKGNTELAKEWSSAFGQAQAKAYPVGACFGLVLGLLAYTMYSRRPPRDHVVSYPLNRGRMFGTAPLTRAELLVPVILGLIGAAAAVCLAALVLPQLSDSVTLKVKPFTQMAFVAAIEGAVVSVIILPFSIRISSGRGWLRRE